MVLMDRKGRSPGLSDYLTDKFRLKKMRLETMIMETALLGAMNL